MIEGTAVITVRAAPGRVLAHLERDLAGEVTGNPGGDRLDARRLGDDLLEVSRDAGTIRYRFRCACVRVDDDLTEVTCHMWMRSRPGLGWVLEPIARRTLLADPDGLVRERLTAMKERLGADPDGFA